MQAPIIQHFILTRFNLRLWSQDKHGNKVRTRAWLDHRFEVFEKYCLPSIVNQTCKLFEWIVLFDNKTPEEYKEKISKYQELCPQLTPVFVEPEKGRLFGSIFLQSVLERLKRERVITTYLDNDDALDIHFVEDIQQRALGLNDNTFIFYSSGYQYFTEFGLLLKICYRRNHFVSVVESGSPETLRTIYGYGSHYYIDRIPGAKIEYVRDLPLWCEVIHSRNMGNDAYFLWGTKMVRNESILREEFCIDEPVCNGFRLYLLKFIPRYIIVFFRRTKHFLFGRKW